MKKKVLSSILCLAMLLGATITPMVSYAADADNYMDVATYRSGEKYTYPTSEDTTKVFAGWYTDADFKKPLGEDIKTGKAYAKFVNKAVLSVKYQVTEGTETDSAETDVRLLTTVDSVYYKEVGFILTVGDRTTEPQMTNTVYERVAGWVDEEANYYAPTVFDETSKYFMAYEIQEVPHSAFTADIQVDPVWTTLDGTTVYGVDNDVNIASVAEVNDIDNGYTFESANDDNFFTTPYVNGESSSLKRVAYADTTIKDKTDVATYGEYGLQGTIGTMAAGYPSFKINLGKTYPAGSKVRFSYYYDGTQTNAGPARFDIWSMNEAGTQSGQTYVWTNYGGWYTTSLTLQTDACALKMMIQFAKSEDVLGGKVNAFYLDNIEVVEDIASAATAVTTGQKLYFGAVTKENALKTKIYNADAIPLGTISESDLTLVESFDGSYGIYCYTVSSDNVKYVYVPSDAQSAYYTSVLKEADDTTSTDAIVDEFITAFGITEPSEATVTALSGQSALFVGDSITRGQEDHNNIYGAAGWAGRIGYYCDMTVKNNGVSGACISDILLSTYGADRYIYNNLAQEAGNTYDYVIMHGLYNDAARGVALGTPQGKANFNPDLVDESTFAGGLELLFYTAQTNHSTSKLGFIVNFKTLTSANLAEHVAMAIQICEDWGIPYLNLYESDVEVDLPDKLHPSSAGYDTLYASYY